MFERAEHEPADGVPVVVGEFAVEQLVQLVDRHPAVDQVVAVRQVLDLGALGVVLVDDLADQLLEAVLERDQPGDVAVLVGDDREVELAGLHLAHQPADRLVLGDEPHRAHEIEHRQVAAVLALGPDQVLRVGEADHVVVAGAEDRQPAVPVGDRQVERCRHRGIVRDDHHVGPRQHHLAGDRVAELDDALDQLALFVFDHLVLGGRLDDAEQFLLADERALLEALARTITLVRPISDREISRRIGERHQRVDRPSRDLSRPLGVDHGLGLRHRLGEHEEHDDVQRHADHDTPRRRTGARRRCR